MRGTYYSSNTLKKQGFEQCLVDPCIFRLMGDEGVKMILAVHVDDMIVVGRGQDCENLRASLSKSFPTKSLGELRWYMGCSFDRDRTARTLKISQPAFVDSLVEKFDVSTLSSAPACSTVELDPRGRRGRTETAISRGGRISDVVG